MTTQNNRNYSNFPNGFDGGVLIQDLLGFSPVASQIFWVGNNPVLLNNEKIASDGNKGSFYQPFATIDWAIGQCSAQDNNVIIVREGYTETIIAASGITCDVAGVYIVGTGQGSNRPTITFGTSTAASIVVSAANVTIKNIVGLAGIDGLTNPFHIQAAGCTLDIEWQDASSTVEAARAILTTAAANNLNIDLKYIGFPAGNASVNAIRLVGTDNALINIDAYGIFSTSIIEFLTTACTNVTIGGYFYNSGTTNLSKDIVDTATGSTWFASGFDGGAGAGFSGGSGSPLASDDVSSINTNLAVPSADSTANALVRDVVGNKTDAALADTIEGAAATTQSLDALSKGALQRIGADNTNNTASTSLVVANRDGSVLERLEALMDPLGGYDPLLGFRVTKVSNLADGAGTDDLFTVTGRCLITHFSGEVTTVIGGAATLKIRDITNSVDLCAATTIDTDAVGTMYSLTSITANILNGTGATPVIGSVPNITGALPMPMAIVGDVQAALTLSQVLDAADTGAITWVLYYKPLTAVSSITAAA